MALQRITHTGAAPPTGLAFPISASATALTLINGTGYPTGAGGPFVLDIDAATPSEEKVLCQSLSGNNVTVAPAGRGYDGTSPAAHNAGALNITHVITSAEADDSNAHIYDTTRDDHTQYAPVNGARWNALEAYNASAQAVTTGAVLINFDTISYNAYGGSPFNPSTHLFTCPHTGVYVVRASIGFSGTGALALLIFQNGALAIFGPAFSGAVPNPSVGPVAVVEGLLSASAGDTFGIYSSSSGSSNLIGNNAAVSYANFTLVH